VTSETRKPFAPSQSRLAFAARQGLMLQSPVLWFGLLLILNGFVGLAIFRFTTFFSLTSLTDALQQQAPAVFLKQQIWRMFQFSLLMFLPATVLYIAAVIRAGKQKKHGQSNVPVAPGFSTRKEDLLVGLLTFAVAGAIIGAIFKNGGFSYSEIAHAPRNAADRLLSTCLWACISAGAIAVLGGMIQWNLRKTRLYQHLSLTRSELEKEQRLHGHTQIRRQLR
jgi:flagellar biosynthesis protein FlhB